jgi:hypothetical protein
MNPRWRKSSYSGNGGANCVEAAYTPHGMIAVRDSKDPEGPRLTFSSTAWQTFTSTIKTAR